MKRLMIAAAMALATTSASAQAQPADPHHPGQAATPTQPAPPAAQQEMMGGGMPMMMNMMRMMATMGSDMAGMGAIDHIEGRIAFLRAEIKITEAQTSTWSAYADALRANAKRLGELRASMMQQSSAAPAASLTARLDLHERWLLARLEGVRSMKAALANLYGMLSDEQKKAADELLAAHMGMRMMRMMSGQGQPGNMGRMQPGQMMPRQTPQPVK
jgi:uncharacterized small protein (DUF1192 family)